MAVRTESERASGCMYLTKRKEKEKTNKSKGINKGRGRRQERPLDD